MAKDAIFNIASMTKPVTSLATMMLVEEGRLKLDDEVAKYLVATPETVQAAADIINRRPDRFIFGTDEVAPTEQAKYLKVYDMYAPLFAKLTPEASRKVRLGNYERLFDQARRRVRDWEKANPK